MHLYKYGTSERIDVLRNTLVRFTQASDFNDPFELAPHVVAMLPAGHEDAYLAEFEDSAQQHLENAFDERLASLLLPPGVKAAARAWALANFRGADLLAFTKRMLPHLVEGMKPTLAQHVQRNVGDRFGVLSLTEDPANLLMWAHYGECHRGLVFEFDITNPFFSQPFAEGAIGRLFRVTYSQSRPAITMYDTRIPLETHVENLTRDTLLTKSIAWQYEQEWRLIYPLDNSEQYPHKADGRLHLFPFPASALRSVILGARATDATLQAVRAAIHDSRELAHVAIKQCSVSHTHFQLEIKSI